MASCPQGPSIGLGSVLFAVWLARKVAVVLSRLRAPQRMLASSWPHPLFVCRLYQRRLSLEFAVGRGGRWAGVVCASMSARSICQLTKVSHTEKLSTAGCREAAASRFTALFLCQTGNPTWPCRRQETRKSCMQRKRQLLISESTV